MASLPDLQKQFYERYVTFSGSITDLANTFYTNLLATVDGVITATSGTINNVIIGGTTPLAGTFTTLTANTNIVTSHTITTPGTTGNQTINKSSGRVNIAAAGTTITVTNSLVTANSHVFAVLASNDTTARIANVVPGAGSFVVNLTAAATAETKVSFFVVNGV